MANINEHKTKLQVNYGWGLSFNMTNKYPLISKRIWNKLSDAQAYVDSATESAIAGLLLRVVNDTERKNGVYWVKQAAGEEIYIEGKDPNTDGDPIHKNGILVKLGDDDDNNADFVNVTGDTMTGTLNINGGNLNVTGDTSLNGNTTISGDTIGVEGKNKVNIITPSYNLTGTTTNMKGTDLTVDYDNVNLSGNTTVKVDTSLLNVDSEDITVDGNNLTVTEKNTTVNSTDKVNVNSKLVDISGTTTNMEGTDLTVDYDNVNLSGNTTVKVDTPLLNVDSEDITVDGNNLTVTENKLIDVNVPTLDVDVSTKVDITAPSYNLTGTTTNMEGTDLTVKYDTTNLSGKTINLSGNTTVKVDTPLLNVDSEDITVDGNNLTANENNINISGTTTNMQGTDLTVDYDNVNLSGNTTVKVDTPLLNVDSEDITVDGNNLTANENNINISGTTTNMQGTDLTVDYDNVNLSGNTTVKVDTPLLNVDSEDITVDGNNLTVTEKNTTVNSTIKIDINSKLVDISGTTTNMEGTDLTVDYDNVELSGSTEVQIDTPLLDVNSTSTTVDGNDLTVNENNINISGTTTNMDGTDLTVDYNNVNTTANTVVNNFTTEENNISTQNNKITNINTTATTQTQHVTNENDYFDNWNVSSTTINITGETTNMSGNTLTLDYSTINISGDTNISKTLNVSGDTHLHSDLQVDGDIILDSNKRFRGKLENKIILTSGDVKSFNSVYYNNEKEVNVNIPTKTSHINIDSISIEHDTVKEQQSNVREAYKLMGNKVQLGQTITIYKDSSLKTVELSGDTSTGKQYLVFTYINTEGNDVVVNLDVSKFLVEAEFSSGLTVGSDGVVSVLRDTNQSDTNNYLTVTDNGVGLSGITDAINEKGKEINNVIKDLDLSQVGDDGNYIKFVSQLDGQVSATEHAFDTSVSRLSTDDNAPTSKAVWSIIDTISGTTNSGLASARTEVKEGTDANNNMSISKTNGADGHDIYTITLSDVASESAFTRHNHDARYVNVTGDTMSGSLTIGTGNTSITLSSTSGTIDATGAIYSSDRTLKKDIKLISQKDIESVGKIDLKSYKFKDDETNRERYGVIAQELEDVNLSNLVVEGDNGKKGVDYVSFLILKIAQLEQEIKELKNR